MENAGILDVFPIFHTARLGQKIRRIPQLPLCGVAIVNFRRGAQLLFQTVGPNQRRGAVHFVKFPDFPGNFEEGSGVVQFLLYQLLAENAGKLRVQTNGNGDSAGLDESPRSVRRGSVGGRLRFSGGCHNLSLHKAKTHDTGDSKRRGSPPRRTELQH